MSSVAERVSATGSGGGLAGAGVEVEVEVGATGGDGTDDSSEHPTAIIVAANIPVMITPTKLAGLLPDTQSEANPVRMRPN